MKILVIGASGPLGREVLRTAAERSHTVTALVRNPDKLGDLPRGVKVTNGDLLDKNSLEAAVVGQDAVVSAFGIGLTRKPTTVLSDGTRNMIDAMKAAGVLRFVCVTGIGAGDSKGHGGFLYDHIIQPFILREIYNDKTRQEEVIRQSGLDWTIVRPAMLTNGVAKKEYKIVTDLDGFSSSKISRRDVADFLITEAETGKYLKQAPVLTY